MRSQRAAHVKNPDEVDEMNTDERLGKLEVRVEHLQADVTEVKVDVREVKKEVQNLRDAIHALSLGLEKFKGQIWVALAVLFVLHLLTIGGVPAAIARAFKFP
jgi:uncharacterized coiled-coil protein SlyX